MNLETSEQNGIGTARLDGSLDGKTAPEVREQLRPFLAANSKMILDLTKVDYLSSAGLRLLLLLYRELSARKGQACAPGRLRRYPDRDVPHRLPELLYLGRFGGRGGQGPFVRRVE